MDPISAMIGGGAAIAGSIMNTSSAQAINSAQMQLAQQNLQFQNKQVRGEFLPSYYTNLVEAGKESGLNPLALIGAHVQGGSGTSMTLSNPEPGRGLMETGRILSQMDLEKRDIDLQRSREELQHQAALTKQTNIDNAIRFKTLSDLEQGKIVSGPEPALKTSLPANVIEGSRQVGDWISEQYNRLPEYIRRPQESWDWRDFYPEFRHTPW